MPNTQVKFGYEGKAGTCLWCGRKLGPTYSKLEERFVKVDDPEYGKIVTTLDKADKAFQEAAERALVTARQTRSHYKYKGYGTMLVREGGKPSGYKLWKYVPDVERGYGYLGEGHFDTMYCGWQFGLVFAGDGHRLKAKE